MMEHILRINDDVWTRLEAHQARLSASAGRHVSLNEALLDLVRPRQEFERCQCSPASNPGCPIAGHPVPHGTLALWFTEDAANPEDDIVVCASCRAADLEAVLIEGVAVCECSPESNPGCEQGSHAEGTSSRPSGASASPLTTTTSSISATRAPGRRRPGAEWTATSTRSWSRLGVTHEGGGSGEAHHSGPSQAGFAAAVLHTRSGEPSAAARGPGKPPGAPARVLACRREDGRRLARGNRLGDWCETALPSSRQRLRS